MKRLLPLLLASCAQTEWRAVRLDTVDAESLADCRKLGANAIVAPPGSKSDLPLYALVPATEVDPAELRGVAGVVLEGLDTLPMEDENLVGFLTGERPEDLEKVWPKVRPAFAAYLVARIRRRLPGVVIAAWTSRPAEAERWGADFVIVEGAPPGRGMRAAIPIAPEAVAGVRGGFVFVGYAKTPECAKRIEAVRRGLR